MLSSKFAKIAPVEADQLLHAYHIGARAAGAQMPKGPVTPAVAKGSSGYDFSGGTPIDRALWAIRGEFAVAVFEPLIARILALGQLMKEPEMIPFLRPVPDQSGQTEVSACVFFVAAKMPLKAEQGFAKRQFFEQVTSRLVETEG
ncbi:MAG: hypothetical protein EOO77_13140 [Oxalobacteraceae bacterium]|nr:MAG: hypothetical protein EOO77_13140 [Oxalobacteraceae bacterium]